MFTYRRGRKRERKSGGEREKAGGEREREGGEGGREGGGGSEDSRAKKEEEEEGWERGCLLQKKYRTSFGYNFL